MPVQYLRVVLERHGAPPTGSDDDKDNAQVDFTSSPSDFTLIPILKAKPRAPRITLAQNVVLALDLSSPNQSIDLRAPECR